MARPKTPFRNELKTRVRDTTFDAVQRYMRDNRCASEARAISDLLEIALFVVSGLRGDAPRSKGRDLAARPGPIWAKNA